MKKTYILFSLFFMVIIIYVIYCISGPIKIKDGVIKYERAGDFVFEDIDEYKDYFETLKEENSELSQIIRKNNFYPSDDINDYLVVSVFLNIQNLSFFDIENIISYLDVEDDNSIILAKDIPSYDITISGYEQKNVVVFQLDVYKGEKDVQEIIDYIKNQYVDIYCENLINGRIHKRIRLDEVEFTVQEYSE